MVSVIICRPDENLVILISNKTRKSLHILFKVGEILPGSTNKIRYAKLLNKSIQLKTFFTKLNLLGQKINRTVNSIKKNAKVKMSIELKTVLRINNSFDDVFVRNKLSS
jgi:hypothetical protein